MSPISTLELHVRHVTGFNFRFSETTNPSLFNALFNTAEFVLLFFISHQLTHIGSFFGGPIPASNQIESRRHIKLLHNSHSQRYFRRSSASKPWYSTHPMADAVLLTLTQAFKTASWGRGLPRTQLVCQRSIRMQRHGQNNSEPTQKMAQTFTIAFRFYQSLL